MSISKDSVSLETLQEQIKIARDRMQQLWDENGHTDDEVLAAGIEVDCLLNDYDRVTGLMQERKKYLTSGRKSKSPSIRGHPDLS